MVLQSDRGSEGTMKGKGEADRKRAEKEEKSEREERSKVWTGKEMRQKKIEGRNIYGKMSGGGEMDMKE